MPASPSLSTASDLEYNSYCEDRDFRAEGKLEPNSRSQNAIYHRNDKTWWVKVTFNGDWSSFSCNGARGQIKPKRERCNEFQDFVKTLDFRSYNLLDNTVTEVILEDGTEETAPILVNQGPEEDNGSKKLKNLQISLREDPARVIYPPAYQFPNFRAIENTELSQKHEIADGVFRVLHENDNKSYILKVVNRPFYQPRDSNVI